MDEAFRWIEWNRDHATLHGCEIPEIESVVRRARRHEVRNIGGGKWRVIGRGTGDRVVEVIFLRDPDGTLFVIHAMPLITRRRRRGRRRR
jgi:hypothetical protein